MKTRYKKLKDGEGRTVNNKEMFKLACCDCGLIHDVAIVAPKLRKGVELGFAVKRDKRATAQRRRWMKKNDKGVSAAAADTRTTTNPATTMNTLTTEEHLNRILAKCKSLLETARKRTPGTWNVDCGYIESSNDEEIADMLAACSTDEDITFIASCAGPAEAGWLATINAIEYIRSDVEIFGENTQRRQAARSQLNAIIAAWPEELLS